MSNNRRNFLKNGSLLATSFLLGKQISKANNPAMNLLVKKLGLQNVSIFYTGDIQGRVRPFSYGSLNDIGGINNIFNSIKKNSGSGLLLDAGDFLGKNSSADEQKQLISLMNDTGYQAVTMGDAELAGGQDHLASLLPFMNFKMVNCNYEFTHPVLKSKVVPFHIFRFGTFKIGVTGVGPDIRGKKSSEGVTYHSPYKKANEVAAFLKEEQSCDMVICLSHIGMEQKAGQPGNKKFAAASNHIDVIIGAHNRAIMPPQLVMRNKQKHQVIIANPGTGGSVIGKLNFAFNNERKLQSFECKNYIPGSPAGASFYEGYKQLSA